LFKLFFWLVWWVRAHSVFSQHLGFSIHKWNPGFSGCYDVAEKCITTFVVLSKKTCISRSLSLHFAWTCKHFWKPCYPELVIA
jgi:hypothetical protein